MIRVRYIYSACVVIDTPDLKLLCDPWFTDGAFDGAWSQFPVLPAPLDAIGDVDAIYISHIHPDHYDPTFLRAYFAAHGEKPLLIADFPVAHLARKMKADGFAPRIGASADFGATHLDLIPDAKGSESDVDSALVVSWKGAERWHVVLNFNDCIFNDVLGREVAARLPARPDIALLGYTSAGPFPQTYHDDPVVLAQLSARVKQTCFDRYRAARDFFDPRATVPFAGQYLLSGKMAGLNKWRGVADPVEVAAFCQRAVVLDDGGAEWIDTETLKPTRVRTAAYPEAVLAARIAEIERYPLAYETLIPAELAEAAPIERLLRAAHRRALSKSECAGDYFFVLNDAYVLNAKCGSNFLQAIAPGDAAQFSPRSEVTIDPRLLFGLLSGVFHWNNAEVGSFFTTRRTPDEHNRAAQGFLNFLSVI